jgi:hypothetical protein
MRADANIFLDSYFDPSWLEWARPAGLMPATQQWQQGAAEAAERRKKKAADRKKSGAETRAAAAPAKPAPKKVERKESKGSFLGLDLDRSDTESAGTDKSGRPSRPARSGKSKVDAKVDATDDEKILWAAVKAGRIPAGYIRVSRQFFVDSRKCN